jgi:hypothetical protein
MRSAGNFSPEWGYLAPAPSFMRTARVVLVATAVGATAGAAVVLSLVDRPVAGGEATAVAAHAIVTSVQAATVPAMPAPPAPVAVVTPPPAATPIIATPDAVKAPAVSAAPTVAAVTAPIAGPSAPIAALPAENTGTTDMASVRRAAPGMAALSDASPTSDATASDIPETPTIAVEGPLPQKKVKRTGPPTAKSKSNPTLGSVLGSLFNPHH